MMMNMVIGKVVNGEVKETQKGFVPMASIEEIIQQAHQKIVDVWGLQVLETVVSDNEGCQLVEIHTSVDELVRIAVQYQEA